MIHGRTLLAAGLACAAFAASAEDQIYRWIDEQGKLHISDTPPMSGAKKVETSTRWKATAISWSGCSSGWWEADSRASTLAASGPASLAPSSRWLDTCVAGFDRREGKQQPAVVPQVGPGEPYALQLARKNAPVKLYSAPGCEPCSTARELLNSRGIPFEEVSVVDDKAFEDLKKAAGGGAVPSLVVGGSVQQGFEERTYHRMLDAAGYPKTGVLPVRAQEEPKAPVTESAAAEAEPAPLGPYAPDAPPRQRLPKK
jgi:glutaredoxin